jgi:hypothetical protein
VEPTYVTPGRYSKRSGIRSATARSVAAVAALHSVIGALDRLPAGLRQFVRRRRGDARADVDRELLVRLGDPELDHGRAVVVEMLVQPRLRLHAHPEVVDALVRGRRRLDAQRVEVVGDRLGVAVLGQVADREVHQGVASLGAGIEAPPK